MCGSTLNVTIIWILTSKITTELPVQSDPFAAVTKKHTLNTSNVVIVWILFYIPCLFAGSYHYFLPQLSEQGPLLPVKYSNVRFLAIHHQSQWHCWARPSQFSQTNMSYGSVFYFGLPCSSKKKTPPPVTLSTHIQDSKSALLRHSSLRLCNT